MKKLRLSFIILFLIMVLNYPGSSNISVFAAEDVDFNIIAVTPYTIVKVGASVDVIAYATANGINVNDFIYKTGNKKIATVNTKGKITAISPGECKINVSSKKYSKCGSYNIDIKVVKRVIKISGLKKYEAGKTYSLKASEKNVTWRLYNTDGYSANASIDPLTGKIKVRKAGSFYVECNSKDGKGLGGVYIYSVGPVIREQDIRLDPIIIDEDLHIASTTELYAIDQLPKTVTVPYKNQGKYGEIKVKILWGGGWSYSWDHTRDEGYYTISGWLDIPDEYTYLVDIYELKKSVQISIILTTPQTDIRKEIISIAEVKPIVISEDLHITTPWQILEDYLRDTMLLCTLEDGSVVKLPIGDIDSSESSFTDKGTYEFKLRPEDTPGYSTKDDPYAKLTVVVEKEQTWQSKSEYELNLDTIAPVSWVTEFTSQVPLGKYQD